MAAEDSVKLRSKASAKDDSKSNTAPVDEKNVVDLKKTISRLERKTYQDLPVFEMYGYACIWLSCIAYSVYLFQYCKNSCGFANYLWCWSGLHTAQTTLQRAHQSIPSPALQCNIYVFL
jgi:hypothetical protein